MKKLIEPIIVIAILGTLIGIVVLEVANFINKSNVETKIQQVPTNPGPMKVISEGYLVKETDPYGREIWKIGTQEVKPSEKFCILSDSDSPTFTEDLFGRYSISILRSDQLYRIYTVEFRQYESIRNNSWVEQIWGIKVIK